MTETASPWMGDVQSSRIRTALDLLPPEGDLLEVGCASGDLTRIIAARVRGRIVGVDPNVDALAAARNASPPEPRIAYHEGTVYRLPGPAQAFDVVVMLQVLEHIDAPVRALREVNRVLRPGGTLLLSTVNAHYWPTTLDFFRKTYRADRFPGVCRFEEGVPWARHITTWDLVSLSTLLHETGFRHRLHRFANVVWDATPARRAVNAALERIVPGLASTLIVRSEKTRESSADPEV